MKYVFTTDGDGHWFLIPEELSHKFNQMLEEGESDYYASFCNYFEQYASDDPRNLTFIKSELFTLELSDMSDDNVVQLFKDKKEKGGLKRDDIQYFLDELDRSLESFHSLGPMDKFNLYKTLVGFTHTSLGLIKLKGE